MHVRYVFTPFGSRQRHLNSWEPMAPPEEERDENKSDERERKNLETTFSLFFFVLGTTDHFFGSQDLTITVVDSFSLFAVSTGNLPLF